MKQFNLTKTDKGWNMTVIVDNVFITMKLSQKEMEQLTEAIAEQLKKCMNSE